jgi:hypothetical protein
MIPPLGASCRNKLLEPVKSWNATDLMAAAGKIKAEYDATPYDLRPWEILIDVIGLGAASLTVVRNLASRYEASTSARQHLHEKIARG